MKPHCPYCRTSARPLFVAKDRNRRLGEAPFAYYRCTACRLVFLHPVPADLGKYYPAGYYPIPTSLSDFRAAAEAQRFKLNLITPFVRAGALLEVGPAFGAFALLAKDAGFDVEVVEMDARCCAFLREVGGIRVIQDADVARAICDRGPYDVVALWHVVEHLPDFGPVLTALAARVRPGGYLVVATPNPDSLQFRLLGRYWAHTDAPRHVVLIPRSLLVEHMRSHGFSVASATMTDLGGLGWNHFGWQTSLANFTSNRFGKSALSLLGTLVSGVMQPLERNDRIGSAYTYVFRKDVAA